MSVLSIVARVFQLEQELAREIQNLKIAMEFDSMASELEKEPVEKKKAAKKAAAPEGQEKPKREPNAWIRFTQRLDALFKSQEMKVGGRVCLLFASHLKKESGLELTDEAILQLFQAWTPPPKAPKASESESESIGEAKPKKERKPQSEETKAAAAVKRAATKASAKAAKAAVSSSFSLKFEPFSYKEEDCWQNERGDTLNPEGEWMGRFEAGKLNATVAKPEDLEAAIAELME